MGVRRDIILSMSKSKYRNYKNEMSVERRRRERRRVFGNGRFFLEGWLLQRIKSE